MKDYSVLSFLRTFEIFDIRDINSLIHGLTEIKTDWFYNGELREGIIEHRGKEGNQWIIWEKSKRSVSCEDLSLVSHLEEGEQKMMEWPWQHEKEKVWGSIFIQPVIQHDWPGGQRRGREGRRRKRERGGFGERKTKNAWCLGVR